jgi:hypothetical protein
MPRKAVCNHSVVCKPETGKCKRSRDGLGAAVRVVRPCPGCEEWRCAAHCWHGRNGKKRNDEDQPGSKKPKTKKTAAKLRRLRAQQQQRPLLPLLVTKPQPPKLPLEVLKGAAFWDSALREVSAAKKSVFVTSLAYDNTRLQQKLVAALARGVKVVVLVRGIRKQSTPSMTDLVSNWACSIFLADPRIQIYETRGLPHIKEYHKGPPLWRRPKAAWLMWLVLRVACISIFGSARKVERARLESRPMLGLDCFLLPFTWWTKRG